MTFAKKLEGRCVIEPVAPRQHASIIRRVCEDWDKLRITDDWSSCEVLCNDDSVNFKEACSPRNNPPLAPIDEHETECDSVPPGAEDPQDETVLCTVGTRYPLIDGKLWFTFHPDKEFTLHEINKDKSAFFFSSSLPELYEPFCDDFGPTNISHVVRFCRDLRAKYTHKKLQSRPLVYYCDCTYENTTNTALMLGAYLMLEHNMSPEEAIRPFARLSPCPLRGFRDATFCLATYRLSVLDCLKGLRKALDRGFITQDPSVFVDEFDCDVYDYCYEPTIMGLNQITPKFIAFGGPSNGKNFQLGPFERKPQDFVGEFRRRWVSMIVRLNEPDTYDSRGFTNEGFGHTDLYFDDCTVPSLAIVKAFLDICDSTPGCVAVHCLAGLGRTGTLIAVYMIKHFGFTAREAIGYLRLMRPGSVIGPQQHFLDAVERCIWDGNTMIFSKGDARMYLSEHERKSSCVTMAQQITSAVKVRLAAHAGLSCT